MKYEWINPKKMFILIFFIGIGYDPKAEIYMDPTNFQKDVEISHVHLEKHCTLFSCKALLLSYVNSITFCSSLSPLYQVDVEPEH